MDDIKFWNIEPNTTFSKGSYGKQSYTSLQELKYGKYASKKGRSDIGSPPRSTTSLSQLKLDALAAENNWYDLDDFKLEELRDGFFDPIYTKPEHVVTTDIQEELYNAPEPIVNGSLPEKVKNRYKDCLKHQQVMLLSHWKLVLKFMLAAIISFILCAIEPVGRWVGHKYRYFLPIASILHHPSRNIGVQLEITLQSIIGEIFALGWSALGWYVSTSTRLTASHQGGILFQSLIMALIFSTWLLSYYQRFFYFGRTFGITIIFLHSVDLVLSEHNLHWEYYRDFALSYTFGIILSLLICLVVYPRSGNKELMDHFDMTVKRVKDFLVALIDENKTEDIESLGLLQSQMITELNINLSQGFRDFVNQGSVAKFDEDHLKGLRNTLTALISSLRILPLKHKLLNRENLEGFYEMLGKKNDHSLDASSKSNPPSNLTTNIATPYQTPSTKSGDASPILFDGVTSNPLSSDNFYAKILRKTFSRDIFSLIVQITISLEKISKILTDQNVHQHHEKDLDVIRKDLMETANKLKKKIYNLDVCYKKFTKSNLFSQELLIDHESVDTFLFLRYLRNSAKTLTSVLDECFKLISNMHWRVYLPHYPLNRALHRLPRQCAIDAGTGNFLHYNETKRDVEEIFARVYNSYTSKHAYTKDKGKMASIRAIDHSDFNFHTTNNPFRYKLWKLTTLMKGPDMKWTLKITFVITFLLLPTWLPESFRWYQKYQCWWCGLIFYILAYKKPTERFTTLFRRLLFVVLSIFWGWAANQAHHFSSPYVICVFAGLISLPVSIALILYRSSKTAFACFICFSVGALEPFSKGHEAQNTRNIWQNTWTTGLSLMIGIMFSVTVNWAVWTMKARTELRIAMSILLQHLSQSYQSVTDRYLYRDAGDAPTELTLTLAHIREVRLTQSIDAVRGLLGRTLNEPNYIGGFDAEKYRKLINCTQFLLEKIIEARMAGTYFEIWDQDDSNDTTRALLSLRRDSVASVIFVFYILSNCFKSHNRIPKYLPNTIFARKKLYDYIAKFEKYANVNTKRNQSLQKQLFKKKETTSNELPETPDDNLEKTHWTEMYEIAFSRAFTEISEAVNDLIYNAKEILGEEFQ